MAPMTAQEPSIPVVPANHASCDDLHVGTPSVFADAGLVEVSRPTPRRRVTRLDF
jgi:hypothetical protein